MRPAAEWIDCRASLAAPRADENRDRRGCRAEESETLVDGLRSGEASVVAVARNGAEAIRTVLEEEPDVLILGPRLDPEEGLGVLHAVRPLLPVLRIVAVGERPDGELRRAFLLGEIDLLLAGPDWADVIPEVLRQWQH